MLKKFTYKQMGCCKKTTKLQVLSAVCLAIISFMTVSCQKNGDLRETPQVTEASVKVVSSRKDPRFSIFIDDKQLEDSLVNNRAVTRTIVKTEGSQHFVVKELFTNTTLIDTMLVLNRPTCSLSVLESDTTLSPLLFISGGSDIHEDSAKLAFYVGDPAIPTPVDIYLYKSNTRLNTLDTVPVHIFRNLNNYTVADFITVDMSSDGVGYNILVKYSGTDQLVPGIDNNTGVVWNDAYSSGIEVYICARPGNSSGLPTNVHNIIRMVKSGNFYFTGCMISF